MSLGAGNCPVDQQGQAQAGQSQPQGIEAGGSVAAMGVERSSAACPQKAQPPDGHVDEEDQLPVTGAAGGAHPGWAPAPAPGRAALPLPGIAGLSPPAGSSNTFIASGTSGEPQRPCRARRPTSTGKLGARVHASDASVKPADAGGVDRPGAQAPGQEGGGRKSEGKGQQVAAYDPLGRQDRS